MTSWHTCGSILPLLWRCIVSVNFNVVFDNVNYEIEFDDVEFVIPNQKEIESKTYFGVSPLIKNTPDLNSSIIKKMLNKVANKTVQIFAPYSNKSIFLDGVNYGKKAAEALDEFGQTGRGYCEAHKYLLEALSCFNVNQNKYYDYIRKCREDIHQVRKVIIISAYQTAYSYENRADEDFDNGDYTNATTNYECAIKRFKNLGFSDHIQELLTKIDKSNKRKIFKYTDQCLKAAEKFEREQKYEEAIIYYNLAIKNCLSVHHVQTASKIQARLDNCKIILSKKYRQEADTIFNSALKCMESNNFDKAITLYQDAESLYQNAGDTEAVKKCKKSIRTAYYEKGQSLFQIGLKYKYSEDRNSLKYSIKYFDAAIEIFSVIKDENSILHCEFQIKNCCDELGEKELSNANYYMSHSSYLEAKNCINLAYNYFSKGKITRKLDKCEDYIKKCDECKADECYKQASNCLTYGKLNEAVGKINQAMEIYEETGNLSKVDDCKNKVKDIIKSEADKYASDGRSYAASKSYERAEERFEQAKDYYRKINDSTNIDKCDNEIKAIKQSIYDDKYNAGKSKFDAAQQELKNEKYDNAISKFEQAKSCFKDLQRVDDVKSCDEKIRECHVSRADDYYHYGEKYYNDSSYSEAKKYFDYAISEYKVAGGCNGKIDSAEKMIEQCESDEDYYEGQDYYEEGQKLEYYDDYEGAIRCYEAAAKLGYKPSDCNGAISDCEDKIREEERRKEEEEEL